MITYVISNKSQRLHRKCGGGEVRHYFNKVVIVLDYDSIDHIHKRLRFKSLAKAQAYAWSMIGRHPDLGSYYAVSDDGIGKVTPVKGCSLKELFPESE